MFRIKYRLKQLILLFGDVACFSVGLIIALTLRNVTVPHWEQLEILIPTFSLVFGLWIIVNYINNLYDIGFFKQKKAFYRRILETAGISFVASILFFYLFPPKGISPKTILLLTTIGGYILATFWRLLFDFLFGSKRLQTRILFVGYTEEVQELIDILASRPENGYAVKAIVEPNTALKGSNFPGIDIYHGFHTIRPVITNHSISLVVIAEHLRKDEKALRELYELLFWDVDMHDLTSFYESITGRIPPNTFSEGWFLDHLRNTTHPIYDRVRLIVDMIAGGLLGVIFALSFPIVAPLIKFTSPGPIFYKQRRVGKGGKHFMMYKYRSMYALAPDGSAETDGVQFAKKEDKRITAIGKFLRKIRLDELPQALNLLKRDITLIGPRPERPEIVEALEAKMPYYSLRHVVKPGLTSWAVIHQNYTDNMEASLQKLQYDLYYIKNRSILLDISICLRTVNVVVRMMGQ